MKRFFLILSFLIACAATFGQSSKLPNTLLWRISGNGLTKSSYLYGTMHLTDKRVFQLGDSVYKAIEQTEGFAGELDMNSLGTEMINHIIADKEAKAAKEAVKVKDAVTASVWQQYKASLADKFHKSAEDITVDDLEEINSSLESDLIKNGDMPTFLDAYLFGVARKLGKRVGGLEILQDQLEHLNSGSIEHKIQLALFDDKYYRSGIESMISIYTGQLLDSLDAVTYREGNGEKDYLMIKRNVKMSRMMDSLSSVRSVCFAVGAAHLPGDSGVLALLKGRGFTVTPVFSSKKIAPGKYVVKGKEIPWVPANITDSVYSINMPGASESIEILKSMGMDMKMYFDLSFMRVYMTLGVELSADRKKLGLDSLYNGVRARFMNKVKEPKEKRVTINGIEGREYSGISEDGKMTIQVFIPAMEEVVMNLVFSMSDKATDDEEIDRFFRSFIYRGLPKAAEVTPKRVWTTFTYSNQLFSIDWPIKPRETKDVNSVEGKILTTYQAVDIKSQVFYGATIISVKEGRYQRGLDSSFLVATKERLKSKMEEARVVDSAFVSVEGYPAYKIRMVGKMQSDDVETKVLTIAKGNRNYYLFSVYSPTDENRSLADRFLSSFKILVPGDTDWKLMTAPDSSFALNSHIQLKAVDHQNDNLHSDAVRYALYDSLISSTTYVDKTILPDWLWYSSDTGFLRQRVHQYKEYSDSIADYKVIKRGNVTTAEFTVVVPGTRLVQKVKLALSGNQLFEIFGHYDPNDYEEYFSKNFDDFIVLKEELTTDCSVSRIFQLQKSLEDGGLEATKRAIEWWNDLKFSKNDLPVLQEMLLTVYGGADSGYIGLLNRQIVFTIQDLDSLNTTVSYIRDNYKNIKTRDTAVIPIIINYLAGVITPESYEILKPILLAHPLQTPTNGAFLYRLYRSPKLTAGLFPEILKYAGSESMGADVRNITAMLIDSSLISKKMLLENGKVFIDHVKKQLATDKGNVDENAEDYYSCIKVLGMINNAETNALLNRLSKLDNRGIRFRTMVAQLRDNQPVDSRTLYTMATTDEYRLDLYLELKKMGKLKLFPVSYLSQQEIGKSQLYKYSSRKNSPAFITYITEKTVEYKGRQQKFLLYKVEAGDSEGVVRLGVSGPYSTDSRDYISSDEATGIYYRKKFYASDIDTLFKDYLASLDETDYDDIDPSPPPEVPPPIMKHN